MCDSMHAVIPALVKAQGRRLTQTQIFEEFWAFRHPHSTNWVTFSGGNPAIHDLSELTRLLQRNRMRINVETQGTKFNDYLRQVDNVTISPKGPGMGEVHDHRVFELFLEQLDHGERYILGQQSRCYKIVVFDERDLQFAREMFDYLADRYGYDDFDSIFYLSLGNVNPPDYTSESGGAPFDPDAQLAQYRLLQEEICRDPVLSKVRFLPQWHAFVWGNEKGK